MLWLWGRVQEQRLAEKQEVLDAYRLQQAFLSAQVWLMMALEFRTYHSCMIEDMARNFSEE